MLVPMYIYIYMHIYIYIYIHLHFRVAVSVQLRMGRRCTARGAACTPLFCILFAFVLYVCLLSLRQLLPLLLLLLLFIFRFRPAPCGPGLINWWRPSGSLTAEELIYFFLWGLFSCMLAAAEASGCTYTGSLLLELLLLAKRSIERL